MDIAEFDYPLPEDLIAQHPLPERGASRLLAVGRGAQPPRDLRMRDLPALLKQGDLLVVNDTRVLRARLFGVKSSGGQVEVLVERITGLRRAVVQIRASKPPPVGGCIMLADAGAVLTVCGHEGEFYDVELGGGAQFDALLERHGHLPLPPYIKRDIKRADEIDDTERYQTIFATRPGAVAAPTAGLHFDAALLDRLAAGGVEMGRCTLHVGAGTFQPIRTAVVEDHHMHRERVHISPLLTDQVAAARGRGARVVAVGTTVVRALESAVDGAARLVAGERDTALYIYPGYRFRVVDALLTNFHLPRSSLLVMVSAFAGPVRVREAYRHAVAARYRFFSYGDAMFLQRAGPVPQADDVL